MEEKQYNKFGNWFHKLLICGGCFIFGIWLVGTKENPIQIVVWTTIVLVGIIFIRYGDIYLNQMSKK